MGYRALSVQAARRAASDEGVFHLWVSARQAVQFREPGWEPLMPHRNGAVLFVHRARQRVAERPTSVKQAGTASNGTGSAH
jgi:hypothetical protein